jgi:LPS export ABC transporter protein LptC
VLWGVEHYLTKEGVVQALVLADTAYLFDARQVAELRGVQTTFYSATGVEHSVMTSLEATYEGRSGDMEARGDVVVLTTDGRRLETDQLYYTRLTGKISSERPFVFQEPGRRMAGRSFISDPNFENLEAQGVTGSAGRVTIPDR